MDQKMYEAVRELRINGLGYKTIAKKLLLGETQVTNWCRDIELSTEQLEKIRKTNLQYEYKTNFLNPPGSIAYYLLGVYFTDGCLSQNYRELILTSKDKDWLEDISKILVVGGKHLVSNTTDNCYRLGINNKNIIDWFVANNMKPAKTLTLEAPEIPVEYIKDFLRGVIDGDGTVSFIKSVKGNDKRKNLKVSITSASEKFANQLTDLINKLYIKCRMYCLDQAKYKSKINNREIKSYNLVYHISLSSSNSVKLCELMYNDEICLERKYNNYVEYLSAREEEKKDIMKKFRMRYLTKEEMLDKVNLLGVDNYAKELEVTKSGLLKKLHKLGIYL